MATTSTNVNLDKLHQLLEEGKNSVDNIKNKDVVLILGNTGAGKTTLENLLANKKLKKINNSGFDCIESDEDTCSLIGHNGSCTDLPHTSEIAGLINKDTKAQIYCCDTPGFLDTRDETKVVATSILTGTTIKQAGNIRGVLIVIDINELKTTRGASLIQLAKTISMLFKNLSEIRDSCSFMFTKVNPELTTDNIYKLLIEIQVSTNLSIKNCEPLDEKKREEFVLTRKFLELLFSKFSNNSSMMSNIPLFSSQKDIPVKDVHLLPINSMVSIINGVENKVRHELRENIQNSILRFKGISQDNLSFSNYSPTVAKFINFVQDKVLETNRLSYARTAYNSRKQDLLGKISHLEEIVEQLELRKKYSNNNKKIQEKDVVLSITKKMEQIHKTRLNDLTEELANLQENLVDASKEISDITENSQLEVIEDIKEGGIFSCETLIDVNLNDRPITKITKECNNGVFSDEKKDYNKGTFSIRFKGGFWSNASVKVEGEIRDSAASKEKVKLLKGIVLNLTKSINNKNDEISIIKKDIKTIDDLRKQPQELQNYIDECSEKIKSREDKLIKYKKLLDDVNEKLKITNNLLKKDQGSCKKINLVLQFIDKIDMFYVDKFNANIREIYGDQLLSCPSRIQLLNDAIAQPDSMEIMSKLDEEEVQLKKQIEIQEQALSILRTDLDKIINAKRSCNNARVRKHNIPINPGKTNGEQLRSSEVSLSRPLDVTPENNYKLDEIVNVPLLIDSVDEVPASAVSKVGMKMT